MCFAGCAESARFPVARSKEEERKEKVNSLRLCYLLARIDDKTTFSIKTIDNERITVFKRIKINSWKGTIKISELQHFVVVFSASCWFTTASRLHTLGRIWVLAISTVMYVYRAAHCLFLDESWEYSILHSIVFSPCNLNGWLTVVFRLV